MTVQSKIIIILTAIIVITQVLNILRNIYKNKLLILLEHQDYETFNLLIQKPIIKLLYPKATLFITQLNYAIKDNNKIYIEKSFNSLNEINLNIRDEECVSKIGFEYYLQKKDKENTSFYLNKLKKASKDESTIYYAETFYDVIINKNCTLLTKLLDELQFIDNSMLPIHEFLISKIYETLGEDKESKKYHDLSIKHRVSA